MDKKTNQVPQHIVLFPDGNRRWAKNRGIDTIRGHMEGYENLKRFCRWCQKRGVRVVTAFGFSTENWNRSPREVNYLMKLFENGLRESLKEHKQKNKEAELFGDKVKFRVIGQKTKLPKPLKEIIKKAEDATKNNNKYFLNLAVSYGGRWDILQAVQKIIKEKISANKITDKLLESHLSTAGLPAPDLIIRPSGEKRLSNFLLWQGAYSEIYFCDKLWPDFTEKDLDLALEEYSRRQRRFGK